MRAHSLYLVAPAMCAALVGCRSAQRSSVADAASDGRCRAEVEGADLRDWREVRGDGFTFCVPAEWRTSGRVAQRGQARVEWNVGVPLRDPKAPVLGTGDLTASLRAHVRGNPTESVRFSEPIDGRPAELYREALGVASIPPRVAYLTGAQWLGPTVHFLGEATELSTAEMQFVIYRTTRFDRS